MRTLEEVMSFIDGYVSAISTNDAELDKDNPVINVLNEIWAYAHSIKS